MSPRLPINNAQTITEFLNLHKDQVSEQESVDSYKFAFNDEAFLSRRETIGIRFELELLKPEILLKEHGIDHTITVFGSTRFVSREKAESLVSEAKTPQETADAKKALLHSQYYESAREFGSIVASYNKTQKESANKLHICTGGGPGIMEAANRGAAEAGAVSVALNIDLPHEQQPNPYVTDHLCFQFHYFALRKLHFVMRARALVAFPGGFGTLDEVFEILTLIQTHKTQKVPVLLYGSAYWKRLIDFDWMLQEGTISQEDVQCFQYVDSVSQAWSVIEQAFDH